MEVKHGNAVIALVLKESLDEPRPLPPEIAHLLSNFGDIVPNDLLNHLPSLRDIQHCIDL